MPGTARYYKSLADASSVIACGSLRALHALLGGLDELLEPPVELVGLLQRRLGPCQPAAQLVHLRRSSRETMRQRVAFLACLGDESRHSLERVGHTSKPVAAANCTENVNEGVVPVTAHDTRWNGAMPTGNDRVTVAAPV